MSNGYTKSNITIASNIYARSSVNLQNDDEFMKTVYGYKALNILKTRFPKSYASRLTRTQVEEMKQNVICRLGKTREHAYGKALVDERVVWSCRCENKACHAYEKCMKLPNALRIDRDDSSYISGEAADTGNKANGEDCGFDYYNCNFEPPHVTMILPILTEILNSDDDIETEECQHEQADTSELDETQAFVREDSSKSTDVSNEAQIEKFDIPPELPARYAMYPYMAEKCEFNPCQRVLVICESAYEVEYFSTLLYKNKVRHRSLCSDGYTLNRRIADVFWDYCGEEIEKDAFFDRCFVRIGSSDHELAEFYEALYKLCGSSEIGASGGLRVADMADALNGSPELISECVLNMGGSDEPVTISTIDKLSADDAYDEVMVLEGKDTLTMHSSIEDLFGSPPMIIQKESLAGWVFGKSALGRPCRISLDNYRGVPGSRCLNVQLGLWGDVDGKSFLAEQMGDAIRLQLYISEKLNEGDELTVEKNPDNGGYWFFHNGNMLGEFPEAIIREVRAIEGFPDDFIGFEGIYVRNIVTCISEKNDPTISARFRESRIWLGLDITGYAKVLI